MECPVCWNNYDSSRRPVAGSCGHSLCNLCASSLDGGHCPSCRQSRAFQQPITNYLASELNDQLVSSVHSLERRETVIQDLQSQIQVMDADLTREMAKGDGNGAVSADEWEVVPELGKLQQENVLLKRTMDELADRLSRCEGVVQHYKTESEKIQAENGILKNQITRLEDEQKGFLRREVEFERKEKERNDWDLMEDYENVPQPENVVMVLPTMKLISDDTKKQLTDLGVVLIHRADLASRQILTASKKQYHETVVPMVNQLVKKAADMIV